MYCYGSECCKTCDDSRVGANPIAELINGRRDIVPKSVTIFKTPSGKGLGRCDKPATQDVGASAQFSPHMLVSRQDWLQNWLSNVP